MCLFQVLFIVISSLLTSLWDILKILQRLVWYISLILASLDPMLLNEVKVYGFLVELDAMLIFVVQQFIVYHMYMKSMSKVERMIFGYGFILVFLYIYTLSLFQALIYILIEFNFGLPWQNEEDRHKLEVRKLNISDTRLMKNFPGNFQFSSFFISYFPIFQKKCNQLYHIFELSTFTTVRTI